MTNIEKTTKAALFDELMKDVEQFIVSVDEHYQYVEKIDEDDELKESKEKDYLQYLAKKCGKVQGANFGLAMRLSRFKGTFEFYKQSQKSK